MFNTKPWWMWLIDDHRPGVFFIPRLRYLREEVPFRGELCLLTAWMLGREAVQKAFQCQKNCFSRRKTHSWDTWMSISASNCWINIDTGSKTQKWFCFNIWNFIPWHGFQHLSSYIFCNEKCSCPQFVPALSKRCPFLRDTASTQSFPVRTTGQWVLHSCLHLRPTDRKSVV